MADEINLEMVKKVQQYMWSEGDFSALATGLVIVGEQLCESVDVMPGERAVDVACGSGTAALAAARRGAVVTGIDFVPGLLERGRERAAAERLEIEWVEGDAEALPVEDASFDVVLSTFGSMFAPDQARAAAELVRVCRPGGRIGMCNWTPDGLMGELFATIAKHAPPPVKLDPPALWGVEERLGALLGEEVTSLEVMPRDFVMRSASVEQLIAVLRKNLGPLNLAFARVGEEGEDALVEDLANLMGRYNRAGDRGLAAPARYLEVVAHRR